MRVLFDTDVVLDLLLDREPHSEFAALLIAEVERGRLSGYLCATSITTIHYLASKAIGAAGAREQIRKLLSLFEVATVNRAVFNGALETKFRDFEDAVSHEAARLVEAMAIVTRNLHDFRTSVIPVYSPEDLLALLADSRNQEE